MVEITPASEDFMVGKTVSHYKVLEKIGEGGMGEVYRPEDTKLGRNVAVKFLPEEPTRNREALDRFQREARAASAPEVPPTFLIRRHSLVETDGVKL